VVTTAGVPPLRIVYSKELGDDESPQDSPHQKKDCRHPNHAPDAKALAWLLMLLSKTSAHAIIRALTGQAVDIFVIGLAKHAALQTQISQVLSIITSVVFKESSRQLNRTPRLIIWQL
jgi:hypothetical protein